MKDYFSNYTKSSLKFAASAQTVSLGVDRHGRTLKDSSKLNISTIYDKSSINQSSIMKSFSNTILEHHKVKRKIEKNCTKLLEFRFDNWGQIT